MPWLLLLSKTPFAPYAVAAQTKLSEIKSRTTRFDFLRLPSPVTPFLRVLVREYPDKTLVQRAPAIRMPLELKATSDWNPRDSNRRVLTSSSEKLRLQFCAPIYHLLLTVLYSLSGTSATIHTIRLDFLEPTTQVNVRLEASVNHKILANGPHQSKMI